MLFILLMSSLSALLCSMMLMKKKLNFLLMLEYLMLSAMCVCFIKMGESSMIPSVMIFLTLLMVLDSTLGLSALMSSSRSSTLMHKDLESM